MVSINDFKKPDGDIDWKAYRKAQVDAGENCYSCGSYIVFGRMHGGPQQCRECRDFITQDSSVQHNSRVRCPKCRASLDVHNSEYFELYSENESGHDIMCIECDHKFRVEVRVTYTFTSPELLKEEPDPAEEDEDGDGEDDDDGSSDDEPWDDVDPDDDAGDFQPDDDFDDPDPDDGDYDDFSVHDPVSNPAGLSDD